MKVRLRREVRPSGRRLAEPSRRVWARAHDEAAGLGHDYVGTEHLLIALLEDERELGARALDALGITGAEVREDVRALVGRCAPRDRQALDGEALASLGVDLDEVRRRVEESFGAGALERTRAAGGECWPRPTPRLKRVLELAQRDAESGGDVWPHHLLIALAQEREGLAATLLRDRGLSDADLRTAVLRHAGGNV